VAPGGEIWKGFLLECEKYLIEFKWVLFTRCIGKCEKENGLMINISDICEQQKPSAKGTYMN
jgi:hypothetical protein